MRTNIILSLDKRRTRPEGTYPIVLRISHYGSTTAIFTGYEVLETEWDTRRREIRKTCTQYAGVTRINNLLLKKRAEAMHEVTKLEEQGILKSLSISQLKDKLTNPLRERTLFKYMDDLIEKLKLAERFGTARNYKNVLGAFKSYRQGRDISFRQINVEFLKAYEVDFLSRGNTYNGLSVNLRTLRAVYNKAIDDGIGDRNSYPFIKYRIKREATKKRAIPIEAVRDILELDLDEGHDCFHSRNYFIASFLMQGMSFVDMAFLRRENVADGRITYRRRKTCRPYDMKITDKLKDLLEYYLLGKRPKDFVFPILRGQTLAENYKELDHARHCHNDNLKVIGKMVGLEQPLTSYVARHSFATAALLEGIPLKAISSMLGHTSLATTEIYLDSLPNHVLDEYQERICL